MNFTSRKYRDPSYVVQPRDDIQIPGHPTQHIVGIKAKFHESRFDSVQAQKVMKWTDEERMWVESELLLHGDFGRRHSKIQGSIWLIPEAPTKEYPSASIDVRRDIPDALEKFHPGLREHVAEKLGLTEDAAEVTIKCQHVIPTEEGVRPCKNNAKEGAFCAAHAKMHDPTLDSDTLASEMDAEAELASA